MRWTNGLICCKPVNGTERCCALQLQNARVKLLITGATSSHVGTCLLFTVAGTLVLEQNQDIDAQDTNRLQGDLHWGSGVYVCGGKSGYLKNLQGRTSFKGIHMKL